MYFTELPNNDDPGFDEQAHYSRFKKENIIFNAVSSQSYCPEHVGCLSLKTVLYGEESYFVDNQRLALRPGHFLILNDDQPYSSQIERGEQTRVLSIFFQKAFAASVFPDTPAFSIKLHPTGPRFAQWLSAFARRLDVLGYDPLRTEEELTFLLQSMVGTFRTETRLRQRVDAVRPGTQMEIFKRLSTARDFLHASFQESIELSRLAAEARLSVPQLIRQFKNVFGVTPHQYLVTIRLGHAARWLKETKSPVTEIAWRCGFHDVSAFCRAFRRAYGVSPDGVRK